MGNPAVVRTPGTVVGLVPAGQDLGCFLARQAKCCAQQGGWRPNGHQAADRGHGGLVLVLGGPAEPLVGLLGLLNRSGAPPPSIFPLLAS